MYINILLPNNIKILHGLIRTCIRTSINTTYTVCLTIQFAANVEIMNL